MLLQLIPILSLLGDLIYFFILADADHDDEHLAVLSHELIDDAQTFSAQLDFQKAGQIDALP